MKYFCVILAFGLSWNSYAQLEVIFPESIGCPGEPDTLIAIGDTSYVWYLSDDPNTILSDSNVFVINYTGSFNEPEINVATPTDTLSFILGEDAAFCHCQHYVPNRFTPDGDQFNEEFYAVINCGDVQAVRMTICNRMGKVVFDETDYDCPRWNGRHNNEGEVLRDDMYGWRVSFIKEDGETVSLEGFLILAK